MKKFFTLFALLSVGLSAWAQTYMLSCENLDDFNFEMKDNGDGTYSLRKFVYLRYENQDGEKPLAEEYISYTFIAGGEATTEIPMGEFWVDDNHFQRFTGWYDLNFIYDPNEGIFGLDIEVNGPLDEIKLTDDLSFAIEGPLEQELEGVSIIYTRSSCNQWGTLCLPFNYIPKEQDNVTFYQLENVAEGVMTFAPFDEYENGEIFQIWGGTPVVFKLDEGNDDLVVSQSGAYPYIASVPEPSCPVDDWTMYGTFESVNSGSNIYYYLSNDGTGDGVFYGNNITIPPYRAWFTAPDGYDGAPLRISIDDTEGLQFVEQEDGTVKVYYDLQGRKLDEAQKGLKIENGKVIMVK